MWIYLILVFSIGEPIEVTVSSIEKCREAVIDAYATAPHLESATCEVRDTEWRKFIK